MCVPSARPRFSWPARLSKVIPFLASTREGGSERKEEETERERERETRFPRSDFFKTFSILLESEASRDSMLTAKHVLTYIVRDKYFHANYSVKTTVKN